MSAKRDLVTVYQHRSCARNSSEAVLVAFQAHPSEGVIVSGCECQGQCGSVPTVKVMSDNVWYCQVKPEDVAAIAALRGRSLVCTTSQTISYSMVK